MAKLNTKSPLEGGVKSLPPRGCVTARVLTRGFFYQPKISDYFFEYRVFKSAAGEMGFETIGILQSDRSISRIYFFRCRNAATSEPRGGGFKSSPPARRDRAAGPYAFPRNSENFFC